MMKVISVGIFAGVLAFMSAAVAAPCLWLCDDDIHAAIYRKPPIPGQPQPFGCYVFANDNNIVDPPRGGFIFTNAGTLHATATPVHLQRYDIPVALCGEPVCGPPLSHPLKVTAWFLDRDNSPAPVQTIMNECHDEDPNGQE